MLDNVRLFYKENSLLGEPYKTELKTLVSLGRIVSIHVLDVRMLIIICFVSDLCYLRVEEHQHLLSLHPLYGTIAAII